MATAVLTSTPTSIDDAEATTNWTGDTFSLEPDIKVEGSNSVATVITPNAGASQEIYVAGTWDFSGTGVNDQHLRLWANISFGGNLQTLANNGWQIYMSDGTNSSYWTVSGSDAYAGGWVQFVIYTGDTPTETSGTLSKAAITEIGMRFKTLTKPRNVPANAWFDAWTYGDGYVVTGGTSGDHLAWSDIASVDLTSAYGIVTQEEGVTFLAGDIQIGNGATTTYFTMDTEVAVYKDLSVNTGLYKLHGTGSGCNIVLADSVIQAAGATDITRFDFDMSVSVNSMSQTGSTLVRADEILYDTGQTATENKYNDCGIIDHAGADMDEGVVKNYEGTANTSALIYSVAADPDGEMDGMTFTKGTAATHAIEFGILSPLTMTLRDVTCDGYNAADTQNDSTFHFKRTSGTVTLNLIGFVGNYTYRTDGATIVIVVDPVTETINVKDTSTPALNVQNARVLVETAATIASGEMFEAAVTSLTQSAGTATCTTTAVHGLATNDYVVIRGAQPDEYNKVAQVTVSSTTVFTFTVDSGLSSPATGTPVVSFVAVYGLSDASGNVSSTRTWGAAQQLKGWARLKNTVSPFYKDGDIAYTLDNTNGNTINVVLQPDE